MTEQPSPALTASAPPRSGIPAIEAQALVREFGGGARAVDGIDLAVRPGEGYGFLGPHMLAALWACGTAMFVGTEQAGSPTKVALTLGLLAAGILVMAIWARRGLTVAEDAAAA